MLYGIVIALLVLFAFIFETMIVLILFVPIVTYLVWDLHGRVRGLERRLNEKQTTDGKQA